MEKHQFRDIDMFMTDKTISFTEPNSDEKLEMDYDMYEPRL